MEGADKFRSFQAQGELNSGDYSDVIAESRFQGSGDSGKCVMVG